MTALLHWKQAVSCDKKLYSMCIFLLFIGNAGHVLVATKQSHKQRASAAKQVCLVYLIFGKPLVYATVQGHP